MNQRLTRAPSNSAGFDDVLHVRAADELLVEDRRMTVPDQPGLLAKPGFWRARIVELT